MLIKGCFGNTFNTKNWPEQCILLQPRATWNSVLSLSEPVANNTNLPTGPAALFRGPTVAREPLTIILGRDEAVKKSGGLLRNPLERRWLDVHPLALFYRLKSTKREPPVKHNSKLPGYPFTIRYRSGRRCSETRFINHNSLLFSISILAHTEGSSWGREAHFPPGPITLKISQAPAAVSR